MRASRALGQEPKSKPPIDTDMALRTSSLTFVLFAIACTAGCGGPLVAASGRVEYVDGSLLEGPVKRIQFNPAPDTSAEVRQGAAGVINEDGGFELATTNVGPGVYPGQYIVTFTALRDTQTGESYLRPEYSRKKETPFRIDVTGSKDDYLFQLEKL